MALGGNSSAGGTGAIKAGRAFVELFTKNNLAAGLNAANRDLKKFGQSVTSMGAKLAGLGAAGLAPLVGTMSTLNDIAKQGNIAKALGITAESFTGLTSAFSRFGLDAQGVSDVLTDVSDWMQDAAVHGGSYAETFAEMNLNFKALQSARPDEQFYAIADALSKLDPTLAAGLAARLGGDFQRLLPLLRQGGSAIRGMAADLSISSADVEKATAAQKAYAEATAGIAQAWRSVSVAVAPIVQGIAQAIADGASKLREFVNVNKEMVVGAVVALGGVAALGVGMIGLGIAIKGVALAWSAFAGIFAAGAAIIGTIKAILLAPILAIPAALVAAGAAWLAFTSSGNQAVAGIANAINGVFGPTIENMKNGWKGIVDAVGSGDFNQAFKIMTAVAEVEWIRFTNFISDVWQTMSRMVLQVWEEVMKAIESSMEVAADEIEKFFTDWEIEVNHGLKVIGPKQGFIRAIAGPNQGQINLNAAQARLDALLAAGRGAAGAAAGGLGIAALAGDNLGTQIEQVRAASRGTFGGSASAGFFGGDVGKSIKDNTKKTADGVSQLVKMAAGGAVGGLVFTGGR